MKAPARFVILAWTVLAAGLCGAQEARTVSLEDFLLAVPEKDLGFHRILAEELKLRHKSALDVPAADWIVRLLADFEFDPRNGVSEEGSEVGGGLAWMLPKTGTTVSANVSDFEDRAAGDSIRWEAGLSQDIARNAFGRAVRLEGRISDMEIEIARHQIVEAYEDYLARLVAVYLDWYVAYENLAAARQGHRESRNLLANVEERHRRSVALDVDVDKVRLQAMNKEERVVRIEAEYEVQGNLVRRAMGLDPGAAVVPSDPTGRWDPPGADGTFLATFVDSSRTALLLRKAEERDAGTVLRYADDLLPSLKLGVSYRETSRYNGNEEYRLFSSVNMSLPLRRPEERARHETARAELEKTKITTADVLSRVGADLRNLAVRIRAEQKRVTMTEERIAISEKILAEEKENYSFGRTSLNDLIRFVDALEEERFARTARLVQRTRYIVEWLRLSDRLVASRSVLRQHP